MPCKNQRLSTIYALFACMLFLSSCVGDIKIPTIFTGKDPILEWLQTLSGKTPVEQATMASQVLADSSQSSELRNRAVYILAARYNPQTTTALNSLASQYQAGTVSQKINVEETLYSDLKGTTSEDLSKILGLITPSLETQFPYSLIIYVAAERNLLKNSQGIIETFKSRNLFQSGKITGRTSQEAIDTTQTGSIALLLPQSGNIAPITQQIIAGVESARLHLASTGRHWKIYYIDTQNPEWIQQVKILPSDCITIGGPLQTNAYNMLKANNVLDDHVVFSFLPRLPTPEDEGLLSWQFFTKPEDQINAVLNVSTQSLGIHSFGVFAPASPYGKSMESLFTQMATSRGLTVQSANYPLDDIKIWNKTAQTFLDSHVADPSKKELPKVRAPFDAIFFPDAWRNMDQLISTMHYHGAHTKVMLGNSLWEQSLNQAQNFTPNTFALTIFPVAYERTRETPINTQFKNSLMEKGLQASDWSVLGFDFILMADQLSLTKKPKAAQVNQRLNALQINYIGAPFYWTPQGIANRNLFINQPARSGRVPFDLAKFVHYRKDGGALPNQSKTVLTEQYLKEQEQQALDEIDALINTILPPAI